MMKYFFPTSLGRINSQQAQVSSVAELLLDLREAPANRNHPEKD